MTMKSSTPGVPSIFMDMYRYWHNTHHGKQQLDACPVWPCAEVREVLTGIRQEIHRNIPTVPPSPVENVKKYSSEDLETYYRWQAESLAAFREKLGVQSNCEALDALDAEQPSPEKIAEWLLAWARKETPGAIYIPCNHCGHTISYWATRMLTDFSRDFQLADGERMACGHLKAEQVVREYDYGSELHTKETCNVWACLGCEREAAQRAATLMEAANHRCVYDYEGDPVSCTECKWLSNGNATNKIDQWITHILALAPTDALAEALRKARLDELREITWRSHKKDYGLHPTIEGYVQRRIAELETEKHE